MCFRSEELMSGKPCLMNHRLPEVCLYDWEAKNCHSFKELLEKNRVCDRDCMLPAKPNLTFQKKPKKTRLPLTEIIAVCVEEVNVSAFMYHFIFSSRTLDCSRVSTGSLTMLLKAL